MSAAFRISIHFLQPSCHARGEGDEPEWPPSPLRVFQALIAAAAARWNERESLVFAGPALRWLESLAWPDIHATPGRPATSPYRLYVPDNVADIVASAWSRKREASIAEYRSEKDVLPTYLDSTTVHYVYRTDLPARDFSSHLDVITLAARSMTHLGWGIDMVAADAALLDASEVDALPGERWTPGPDGPHLLRCPQTGTLDQLIKRHDAFLRRIEKTASGDLTFNPAPTLHAYQAIGYHRSTDPPNRPSAIFKLLDENGRTYRHSHAKLIHIAGMVRHVAIEAMKSNPPAEVADPAEWVRRYVAGHQDPVDKQAGLPHRQLSYIPLPSIGHPQADPGVRRVMIVAPLGDEAALEHVARHLNGVQLQPKPKDSLGGRSVFLQRVGHDNVSNVYLERSLRWTSFTPVILPGHDDKKPEKTCRLIQKALAQSGIEQPCKFWWSAISRFPKSFSAHKYVRDSNDPQMKRPAGYIRPDHLLNQTAVHLTIQFNLPVAGPILLGTGRHCGLGLLAPYPETKNPPGKEE